MSPVLPADAKALIPTGEDSDTAIFIKVFIKLPILVWRYFKYRRDDGGNLTVAFKQEICAVQCVNGQVVEN